MHAGRLSIALVHGTMVLDEIGVPAMISLLPRADALPVPRLAGQPFVRPTTA